MQKTGNFRSLTLEKHTLELERGVTWWVGRCRHFYQQKIRLPSTRGVWVVPASSWSLGLLLLHSHLSCWELWPFNCSFYLPSTFLLALFAYFPYRRVPTFPQLCWTKAAFSDSANQTVKGHLLGIEMEKLAGLHKALGDVQRIGTCWRNEQKQSVFFLARMTLPEKTFANNPENSGRLWRPRKRWTHSWCKGEELLTCTLDWAESSRSSKQYFTPSLPACLPVHSWALRPPRDFCWQCLRFFPIPGIMSSVWRHWAQNFLGIGWTRLLIHNFYVSSLQCSSFHLCIIIPNAPLSVSNVSLPTLLTFEWALEMGDWEESRRSKEGKRRESTWQGRGKHGSWSRPKATTPISRAYLYRLSIP